MPRRVNDAIFARALQVVHPDGHTSVLSRRDALKAAAEQVRHAAGGAAAAATAALLGGCEPWAPPHTA